MDIEDLDPNKLFRNVSWQVWRATQFLTCCITDRSRTQRNHKVQQNSSSSCSSVLVWFTSAMLKKHFFLSSFQKAMIQQMKIILGGKVVRSSKVDEINVTFCHLLTFTKHAPSWEVSFFLLELCENLSNCKLKNAHHVYWKFLNGSVRRL